MGSLLSNRNVVAAAVVLSLLAHLGVTDAFAYTGLVLVVLGMPLYLTLWVMLSTLSQSSVL